MDESLVKQIIAPVDTLDTSKQALAYVRLFAERFGAKVTLLHAEDVPTPFGTLDPLSAYEPLTPAEEGEIADQIREYAADRLNGVPFDVLVVSGHPARVIAAAARKRDADLIIMGTHARRGWRRALTGSVAETVLRTAASPVLVVPLLPAGSAGPAAITRIICPINFSEVAREALRTASRIAEAFRAELIVIHVAEGVCDSDPRIEKHFRMWLGEEVGKISSVRELVLRGGAAERVLDCVEDTGADLLVMGTQQKRFSNETVIGSTSERLLRFSSVPILTVVRALAKESVEDPVATSSAFA